ncbi:MAG: M23 family metallopeptidase [Ruthenibacterium lactatiformans]|nr:M23 family metallopeptidase [Ruthenibacterium lactatiformans]
MDIPAPAGTPVYAAADGAASLNNHWVMGISVKLDHGGSLATLYGHLSACAVKDGDLVEKGQLIGYVGSTGNSTGNHLHFEVDLNGDPVSAWPYLNAE